MVMIEKQNHGNMHTPAQLRFCLDGEAIEQIMKKSARGELMALDGTNADTDINPIEIRNSERIISFSTDLLIQNGAEIRKGEDGKHWKVTNLEPTIFQAVINPPGASLPLILPAFEDAGLLPEELIPEWFSGYPIEISRLFQTAQDTHSGWSQLDLKDLIEKYEGLQQRYPDRRLIPLLQRVGSDDVLCIDESVNGRIVVIHDYASQGFEEQASYSSAEQCISAMEEKIEEKYRDALRRIFDDDRYVRGINWGNKRKGHSEGTIAAHIEDLLVNARAISSDLTGTQQAKLELFIHTHDTFKGEAHRGVSIEDSHSHASIARAFVEDYIGKTDLSNIIQYHDELYALWRKVLRDEELDSDRYEKLISRISDWDTFITATLVDNITDSKSLEPTLWAIKQVDNDERVQLSFDPWERMNKILAVRGLDPVRP